VANGDAVTVKYLIQAMRADITDRLNRIETNLNTKADDARVERIDRRLTIIEKEFVKEQDLSDLRTALLSPEKVKEMIGTAMQDSHARGWTNKERWMGVAIFIFGGVNFLIGLLALGPDVFGGR
jgi:parvulin-like peptidyl-prolyl isomerase